MDTKRRMALNRNEMCSFILEYVLSLNENVLIDIKQRGHLVPDTK